MGTANDHNLLLVRCPDSLYSLEEALLLEHVVRHEHISLSCLQEGEPIIERRVQVLLAAIRQHDSL